MPREKSVLVGVRMTPALERAIKSAANSSGLGRLDWIRAVLARAANEGAFGPPKRRKSHGKKPR